MKPRYIVINTEERDRFEREWQLPYGYGGCPIFFDLEEAIDVCISLIKDKPIYVIERYDNGIRETINV